MADPLTVLGGLAAVAQLSTSAMKLAGRLYRFAGSVKTVVSEVHRFSNQVRTFSYVVDLAQITLSRHCSQNPESQVVAYLASHQVLSCINSDAQYILGRIRTIRRQIRAMPTRFALVTAIAWMFNKQSVMELYPEMESIKTTLTLLMSTTEMEAFLQRTSGPEQSSDGVLKEMHILQHMLKSQMEALRTLRHQLNHSRRPGRTHRTDPFSSAHQVLVDLGWSMYKDGVVPEPLSVSRSVSELSFASSDTSASDSDPEKPSPGRAMVIDSSASMSTYSIPSSERPSPFSAPQTTDKPADHQPNPTPAAVVPAAPSPPRPTTNPKSTHGAVHIPPSVLTSTISGYIIPTNLRHINTNPRHATAFLVPDLPINIISLGSAAHHNLDIDYTNSTSNINNIGTHTGAGGVEDEGGVLLDFGNGRRPERSIGRTTLCWSRSSQRHDAYYMYHEQPPALVVECVVCQNSEVGLILGRPFVEERERRWGRRNI